MSAGIPSRHISTSVPLIFFFYFYYLTRIDCNLSMIANCLRHIPSKRPWKYKYESTVESQKRTPLRKKRILRKILVQYSVTEYSR